MNYRSFVRNIICSFRRLIYSPHGSP